MPNWENYYIGYGAGTLGNSNTSTYWGTPQQMQQIRQQYEEWVQQCEQQDRMVEQMQREEEQIREDKRNYPLFFSKEGKQVKLIHIKGTAK